MYKHIQFYKHLYKPIKTHIIINPISIYFIIISFMIYHIIIPIIPIIPIILVIPVYPLGLLLSLRARDRPLAGPDLLRVSWAA